MTKINISRQIKTEKRLSKAEAIDIQNKNLAFWKSVLNDETYSNLYSYCKNSNNFVYDDDGYKIKRGQDLLDWIMTLCKY